ncbi:hypothetical protein KCU65_g10037, partial [Aureobasidium melanogenum]
MTDSETNSMQQDSNQTNLATQEVTMEIGPTTKKPIKRIAPEKIAEVGQWEAKVVTDEDKPTHHKEDKAVNEENKAVNKESKAEVSTEYLKLN